MALIKANNINQFGVTEEYYKILGININLQFKFCDITVGGYMSKEARLSESEPMNIRKVRAKWTEDEFGQYFSARAVSDISVYTKAYEYLKRDEYFKDCIID